MKRLIQWSIEHHWMVLGFSVLLLAAGLWTARDMPVDVFPDLTAPTVTILTEGHGMAPDEMESLVTDLIEKMYQKSRVKTALEDEGETTLEEATR